MPMGRAPASSSNTKLSTSSSARAVRIASRSWRSSSMRELTNTRSRGDAMTIESYVDRGLAGHRLVFDQPSAGRGAETWARRRPGHRASSARAAPPRPRRSVRVREVEPGPHEAELVLTGPRPVADAGGEDPPEAHPLLGSEGHLVIAKVDPLAPALEDVAGPGAAGGDADVFVDGEELVAYGAGIERHRFLVLHAGRIPAGVLEGCRLVPDHLGEIGRASCTEGGQVPV